MRSLKLAVCDDEKAVLDIVSGGIRSAFAEYGVETEIDRFLTGAELEYRLRATPYDIVFLDIEIRNEDGVELAKHFRENRGSAELVFISSHMERVFETFQTQPFGFVRKNNFMRDIAEVAERYVKRLLPREEERKIVLKGSNTMETFRLDEIEYIEGAQRYQIVSFRDREKTQRQVSSTMEYIENRLSGEGFYRVHKGFIINFAGIEQIGTETVTMHSGAVIPVSRAKKKEFREKYLDYIRENKIYVG